MIAEHFYRSRFATMADLAPALGDAQHHRWLSPEERGSLARMRDPGRRRTWLAGRYLAKTLLCTSGEARHWHIESRDQAGRPGRPRLRHKGRTLPWRVSLSHCDGAVYAAVSPHPTVLLGVDVAPMKELGCGFAETWFTPRERQWCGSDDAPWSEARIWAAKEAAYKAAGRGAPFIPRQWEVTPRADGRFACASGAVTLQISVRHVCGHIAALATSHMEGQS